MKTLLPPLKKEVVRDFINTTLNSSLLKNKLAKTIHTIQILQENPFPFAIMLEITRRCNLLCSHCINPKEHGKHKDELTTDEIKYIFNDIAQYYDASSICATGISAVTIYHDGKIGDCPHIVPELSIQGDLRKESFYEVWTKRFKFFRNKQWLKKGECKTCSQWNYCYGGAMHYRDVDGNLIRCPYLFLKQ